MANFRGQILKDVETSAPNTPELEEKARDTESLREGFPYIRSFRVDMCGTSRMAFCFRPRTHAPTQLFSWEFRRRPTMAFLALLSYLRIPASAPCCWILPHYAFTATWNGDFDFRVCLTIALTFRRPPTRVSACVAMLMNRNFAGMVDGATYSLTSFLPAKGGQEGGDPRYGPIRYPTSEGLARHMRRPFLPSAPCGGSAP